MGDGEIPEASVIRWMSLSVLQVAQLFLTFLYKIHIGLVSPNKVMLLTCPALTLRPEPLPCN